MAGSGPPYPHPNPKPGSNAIGSFQIGVSPIGTIPAFDIWSTIISQFANSPTLTTMITSFNAAMDLTTNLDDFYDLIWNVLTATGYGLNVWGNIVVAPRTLTVTGGSSAAFGFNEPGNDWTGFNQAPFTQGPSLANNNVTLTDDQYRPLILAKAATNIWDGSMPGLNSILLGLFAGRGKPYVRNNFNMSLTYVFNFALTNLDLAIIETSGVLPQPTGVVINTTVI